MAQLELVLRSLPEVGRLIRQELQALSRILSFNVQVLPRGSATERTSRATQRQAQPICLLCLPQSPG